MNTESNTRTRDYSLDVIRIFAFCLIITFHFCAEAGLTRSHFYGYANGGWGSVGTAIFFILSGYLGAMIDLDTDVKEYYIKRSKTIFPMQILIFLVGYLFTGIKLHNFLYGGSQIRMLLSFIGVDQYLSYYGIRSYAIIGEWFTAMILLMYLLFPMLRILYKKALAITTCGIMIFYFVNIYIGLQKKVVPDASVFTALLLFWLGMVIYRFRSVIFKSIISFICSILIALLVIFVKLPYYKYQLPYKNALAICIFMIFLFLGSRIKLPEALKNPIMTLSNLSFAAYLCHHLIIRNFITSLGGWMIASKWHMIIVYLLILICVIGISYLFDKVIKIIIKKPDEKTR